MTNFHSIHQLVDLKLLQRILGGMSLAMIVAIPLDYGWLEMSQHAVVGAGFIPAPTDGAVEKKWEPFEAYQSVFEKSALFGNPVSAGAPVIKATIQELVKDYRLKGTIITGDPEAIMENAKTQQTFFLKKGQALGELTVKEIKEGVVVLGYLGEEARLQIT